MTGRCGRARGLLLLLELAYFAFEFRIPLLEQPYGTLEAFETLRVRRAGLCLHRQSSEDGQSAGSNETQLQHTRVVASQTAGVVASKLPEPSCKWASFDEL